MAKTPRSTVSGTTRRLTVRQREREREENRGRTPDEVIIQQAQKRWQRAWNWENDFRKLYWEDVKFSWGDSDNMWQWGTKLVQSRGDRPSLTINKVQNHVRLVSNDMKRNKSSIDVRPVNNEGSFKAAQIWEGIIRNIEYESSAQDIYDAAGESAVEGGIGYWRVVTDYVDDRSFDQHILIRGVRDQMSVLLDCDIEQKDGLDAEWGFVFKNEPREEIEDEFPELDFEEISANNAIDQDQSAWWITDDTIRVAEYYRIVKKKDRLVRVTDDEGNESIFYDSEAPSEVVQQVNQMEKEKSDKVETRLVMRRQLEWFKIVGNQIVDRRDDSPGSTPLKARYIPLVRVVGRERLVEGKLERKGLVRPLKDPQRMYNYNSSGQVEYGALATKSPWVGPKSAFAGNEVQWNNANRDNAAYLAYQDWDAENERVIQAPQRPEAPGASPAFINGMQIAATELDMASGQKQAQQGMQGNETSGVAIENRKRQSDLITFDFLDNMSSAIRATGKIVIDMAPHVYDTERVLQILGKDGTQSRVTIQPNQKEAIKEEKGQERDEVLVYFNPRVGRYEIRSEPGPAYATQRQEAWNAFVQIVTGAPDLINEIGDLMFQSADFPLADKIAERLKNKIRTEKPYLFDEQAPTPQMQQMKQELEAITRQFAEVMETLASEKLKNKDNTQRNQVAGYNAETDRVTKILKTLSDVAKSGADAARADAGAANDRADVADTRGVGAAMDQQMLQQVVAQTLLSMLESPDITPEGTGVPGEEEAFAPGAGQGPGQEQPPVPGARRAGDGHWYVQNTGPNASSHPYLRVMQEGMAQMAAQLPKAVASEVHKVVAQGSPGAQANKLVGMTNANG